MPIDELIVLQALLERIQATLLAVEQFQRLADPLDSCVNKLLSNDSETNLVVEETRDNAPVVMHQRLLRNRPPRVFTGDTLRSPQLNGCLLHYLLEERIAHITGGPNKSECSPTAVKLL